MTSLTAIRRKVGLFGNFCCLVLFKSELYPPHLVAYAYLTRAAEKHTPPSSVLAACRRQEAARRPRLGARIEARGRCCTTMIDLAALGSLFVDVFGISKEWSTPKMIRFEHLDDILHEKVVRDLEAEGHELIWVREARLRPLQREGWKPVIERDKFGRPSIFVDRREELVLVHRASQAGA
jgi:hypothetical protein